MYKRVLVPLDGSELAERALKHAVDLAAAFGATLELVRVVPVAPLEVARGGAMTDLEAEVAEAREYLEGLRQRLADSGLQVLSTVRQGDVAEELIQHAQTSQCDLIVMSTHGRSGLARWVYGSIADRVLRYGLQTVPAILVVSSALDQ
ncbi:MAG: universal stress protein [Armatimonadetes bacterium]|nr:universal stress protein [Armatimonadota bacterium]